MDIGAKREHDLYICHSAACWAKLQLTILEDMLGDRESGLFSPLASGWLLKEVRRIREGLYTIPVDEQSDQELAASCLATPKRPTISI